MQNSRTFIHLKQVIDFAVEMRRRAFMVLLKINELISNVLMQRLMIRYIISRRLKSKKSMQLKNRKQIDLNSLFKFFIKFFLHPPFKHELPSIIVITSRSRKIAESTNSAMLNTE